MISKSFFDLVHLDLGHWYNVTEKGVIQAVGNFTQQRRINLQGFRKVVAYVVDLVVSIWSLLRKILVMSC